MGDVDGNGTWCEYHEMTEYGEVCEMAGMGAANVELVTASNTVRRDVETFNPDAATAAYHNAHQATRILRDAAYSRGWNDGAWGEYRGHGETYREEYDAGHAAGVDHRGEIARAREVAERMEQ